MNIDNNETVSASVSVYAIYILAFFCFVSPPMVHLAELIILIFMLIDWRQSRKIFLTLYGKIFLTFVPFALLSALWASQVFGYIDSQFEQALDYIHMSLFIAAGWTIYRYKINLGYIFLLIITGLFLSLLLHFPFDSFENILRGQGRFRIETIHPIQLGVYSAALAIGVFVWFFDHLFKSQGYLRSWISSFLLLLCFGILLATLVLTWSRGPWLGFIAAMLTVGFVKLWIEINNRHISTRKLLVSVVISVAIFVSMVVGSMQSKGLMSKMSRDYQVVEQIISGDVEDIPKTSLGWRVHMNVFAWKKFWERPLLGWGPYVKQVIDNSDLGLPWGHVHNSYWEVLLRFGIVGGILFGAGIIWLIRGLWLDYRKHLDQEIIVLGIYGAFVVLSVWALIDYKFTGWENTAFIWLLGGAAASRALRAKFESSI